MKICRSAVVAAAAAALSASCALAQSQSQSNSYDHHSQQSSAQSENQQQAPEGYVLVKESVITLTVNEPQNHFLRAQEFMSQGDTRAAAAETRIAAAYLDMQASRDQRGDQGKDLQSAADNLRHLATELHSANGQTSSNKGQNQQASGQQGQRQMSQQDRKLDKQLTQAFAEADHALAAHFQARAKQEISQHKRMQAGYDLDAAASSLKAACIWSGQQCPQDVVKAVADARRASDELLTVSGEREIGGQNQASSNQGSAEDQAEPASARINGSDQDQSNSSNSAQQGQQQQTQTANQAIQELGQAIQNTESQIKSGGNQSGNASNENSSDQRSHHSGSNSSSNSGNK